MAPHTPELPVGYSYTATPQATLEQITVLYYPKFTNEQELRMLTSSYGYLDEGYARRGLQTTYLGVQSTAGTTVGTGCLRYNDEFGELSCLAVLPEHRSLGIGKWLIAERIRRAQAAGLRTLYIERLASTNTLPRYYAEQGFTEIAATPAKNPLTGRKFYLANRLGTLGAAGAFDQQEADGC